MENNENKSLETVYGFNLKQKNSSWLKTRIKWLTNNNNNNNSYTHTHTHTCLIETPTM